MPYLKFMVKIYHGIKPFKKRGEGFYKEYLSKYVLMRIT